MCRCLRSHEPLADSGQIQNTSGSLRFGDADEGADMRELRGRLRWRLGDESRCSNAAFGELGEDLYEVIEMDYEWKREMRVERVCYCVDSLHKGPSGRQCP